LAGLLKWAGYLKRGESFLDGSGLSLSARRRLGRTGLLRAEFEAGSYARFRCLTQTEAADLENLRNRAAQGPRWSA
jgi:hypothetical protein